MQRSPGGASRWRRITADRLLTILLGLVLSLLACAHAGNLDPASARFRRVDSTAGLSQDSVQAMVQDRHGFIWLGTQDGLNRFDGYELVVHRAGPDGSGLGSTWISALAVDAGGRLWVGTSAGLYRYHEAADRFEQMVADQHGFAGGFVYEILVADNGELWVGSDAGLSRWHEQDARFQTWSDLPGLPDRRVRSLAQAADGSLWLGTYAGLAHFDPARQRFLPLPGVSIAAQPVNALSFDRDGRLWIGGDADGLLYLDPDSAALRAYRPQGSSDAPIPRVLSLRLTRDGALWVGGESAAYRLPAPINPEALAEVYAHQLHDPLSLGRGRVTSLLEDREGTMWLGTWEGGASRLNPRYWQFLSFDPETLATRGMRQPGVYSLVADGDTLWLGTADGAYRFDTARMRLQEVSGSNGVVVLSLAADPDTAWLGTGAGIRRLSRASGALETPPQEPRMAGARIRRLLLDQGRLWVAAELQGLFVFEQDLSKPVAEQAFSGPVNHLAVYDDSTVLLSASDGLFWFSRDGRRLLHHTEVDTAGSPGRLPGRPSGFIRDESGRTWVTVYGAGLFELRQRVPGDPASAEFIDTSADAKLDNRGVNSIQTDARGRLWMTTDRGISLFDPTSKHARNFDRSDGALGRGYYYSSTAKLADGRIAFGSKDGFTLFDPGSELSVAPPPAPRVTAIERDGQELRPRGRDPQSPMLHAPHLLSRLDLPAGWGRNLLLRLASAEFVAPQQLRYRYRLQGFDVEWNEVASSRRLITYTNLPPGEYELQLQARDRDGTASEITRLQLAIAAYWWQSNWARGLAIGILLGLLWLAYRLRIRRLRWQRERLEQQVEERTTSLNAARRQAEESLETLKAAQDELVRAEKLSALGQLVAGVAHEVNTPLGVAVTAASHIRNELNTLRERMREGRLSRGQFEQSIDNALEGSDLVERNLDRAAELIQSFKQVSVDRSSDQRRRFELAEFLAQLTQSLKLLWKHQAVQLRIECPRSLEFDSFPGALGQVITNLIQNAVLHAFHSDQPGLMEIHCRRVDGDRVELCVRDDGRGIPAESLPRIFEPFYTTRRGEGGTGLGLHIVHSLVIEVLRGKIEVSSMPGQGTTFTITLPLFARH